MPKRPDLRKCPVTSSNPAAIAVEQWENEGGAPRTGDRSHHKGVVERPFVGDFLEHPGSVGEMHYAYDNRNEDARRTSRFAKPDGVDWHEWFVPPIVIPAVIIAVLAVRALYLQM